MWKVYVEGKNEGKLSGRLKGHMSQTTVLDAPPRLKLTYLGEHTNGKHFKGEGKMNEDVAIIEGVYDIVLPEVPASLHRWGRRVWLRDIEVGAKGKLLFFEDRVCKITSLSRIINIIRRLDCLEIYTQRSIYKLRLLPRGSDRP